MKTYVADEPKLLWTLLFILAMTYAYTLEGILEFLAYVAMGVSLLSITTRYFLSVDEGALTFQMKVVGVTLRTKKIEAAQIKTIEHVIVGSKTIFLISGEKGQLLKLHRFKQQGFEEAILGFAGENGLYVKETMTKSRPES